MKFGLRQLRLRAIWLLVVPFVWIARPTPRLLLAGAGVALVGLVIRSWAAGFIRKERELATRGPYAHTRNPLYVGSLLVGVGVTIAGGVWIFLALFLLFYVLVYGRTVKSEEQILEGLFGEEYRRYAKAVPLIVPRLGRYRGAASVPVPFSFRLWRKNREYEAILGAIGGFGVLASKMLWL